MGTVAISVEFTAGTAATLSVTVADTTDYTMNSTISPMTANFDKKTTAQADVATTVTFGKNANNTDATVTAVKVGGATLTAGTDYTLVGNTLTIKKEYLATKSVGSVAVSVEFSAGIAATLSVTVSDTTDYTTNSTVSPTMANFDKKTDSQVDVTTAIIFGKNADNTNATVTAVKVGGATLTAGTDYTLVGNILTIKKEYLATKAVGSVEVSVEFSAGTAATLTVTVSDTTIVPMSITSKTITNYDFSTVYATQAKLVSKPVTVGDFTGNRKDFTIVVGGERIPIYINWALSTDFPRGAAMGSVVESHIQDYFFQKYGINGFAIRTVSAYGFDETFEISTFQTGSTASFTLEGADSAYFFEQTSAQGTNDNTTKNRTFTISDGTKTVTIIFEYEYMDMDDLVSDINYYLNNAGVAVTAEKVNTSQFKLTSTGGTGELIIDGVNKADFFE